MTFYDLWVAAFWCCLIGVFYTYLGYPALVFGLGRLAMRRNRSNPGDISSVTVVLIAHNEGQRITERLTNLLAARIPSGQLQIVVFSDGSTDNTVEQIHTLNEPRVQLITRSVRTGKADGLNAALAAARHDVIVFADARQQFDPETIPRLVAHFQDSRIGAVSGELVIDAPASAVGGGVDAYWRFEKILRNAEARWDSCIGCTGAVYAIRRKLFRPLPPDTILDDVVIPMQIAMQGFRVSFEPAAIACDPQPPEPEREKIRKRRTLAGNYQMLFRYPGWLLPWRNRLWWQLLSHKYLRLAAPWLLLLLFIANAALIESPTYRWLFLGQCTFYVLGVIGIACRDLKFSLLSVPAGFVFLNVMAMNSLWHYLRPPAQPGWDSASHRAGGIAKKSHV